jgi:PAS domain S-box-containing protein
MNEAAHGLLNPEFLAEALGEIIFTNLPDGSCDYVSKRFADYTGIAQDAARGYGWAAAVHPEDVERVRARWLESVRSGHPFESDYRLRGRDGGYRWFRGRKVPLHDRGGHIARWFGTCTDIEEKKRVEDALVRDALLLANVRDSVVVTDLDGVVTYWNEGATRLFGWTAAEMLGRPLVERLPASERAAAAELLRGIAGGRDWRGEWHDYRKDGTRVWIDAHASLLKDGRGRPVGILGLALDISDRKRLEHQYLQAQKMEAVGLLAGGVAHDFNNLLTVITGYGALLLEGLGPGDPNRELVAEITRAGDQAAALTRQLLAFSRKAVLTPRPLDLNAVVHDTEKMLRRLLGEDVRLATQLYPALGLVHADPGHVQQVLFNLAVNARDAMPTGGRLTIETQNVYLDEAYCQAHAEVRPGPYVMLAVSDTGCGMTPDVQSRAFEPFFTTKEPGKGTGLGLATVHGIVRQSGGHVWVSSEPGAGTTFKVYLPRADRPAQPGRSYQGTSPAPRGNETILLVEDDEGVRGLLCRILQDSGYNVRAAAGGREALRLCEREAGPVHLLVTDVVMPEMGGRALAEQLLRLHPGLKVLYVSGYTDDAVIRHGVLEAEVHFLQKPFEPAALAQKVRETLDS